MITRNSRIFRFRGVFLLFKSTIVNIHRYISDSKHKYYYVSFSKQYSQILKYTDLTRKYHLLILHKSYAKTEVNGGKESNKSCFFNLFFG